MEAARELVQCLRPKAGCHAPLQASLVPGEMPRGKKGSGITLSGPLIPESLKGTSNEIEWQAV